MDFVLDDFLEITRESAEEMIRRNVVNIATLVVKVPKQRQRSA
jgi:hypothetical protein